MRARVRNRSLCSVCHEVVKTPSTCPRVRVREESIHSHHPSELASLEAETNSNIELREFIPIEKAGTVYFDGAHYLAPDQGGEKPIAYLQTRWKKASAPR
jgi:DNA end-binding protein Ku